MERTYRNLAIYRGARQWAEVLWVHLTGRDHADDGTSAEGEDRALIPVSEFELLVPSLWQRNKTMEIPGPLFLVFLNPTSEKQFTNLSQTSLFLPSDLQQRAFDFARYSEPNPVILVTHNLRGF